MIVILGGGISGLAAAWYLKQKTDRKIVLLEKSPRLGGWIRSTSDKGFFFEHGPRSLRPNGGEETLRLIQTLGLEDQIVPGEKAAHERYLYFNHSLHKMPRSLGGLLTSPWIWPVVPPLLTEWTKPPTAKDDESIYQFISRRFNSTVANRLMDPMAKGIFAGDIHTLSMKSCFPGIYCLEHEAGSLTGGMWRKKKKSEGDPLLSRMKAVSLYTLRDGLEILIEKLALKLNIEVRLASPVTKIDFQSGIRVQTPFEKFQAEHVISALPAHALASLMPSPLPEQLGSIFAKSLSVAHIGYHSSKLQHQGFGYLIPSTEGEKVLGMVWDSSAFPVQNQAPGQTRLTLMMESGGEETVLSALKRHLGIAETPDYLNIFRASRAIPQYTVGHSQRVKDVKESLRRLSPNFHVIGNSFEGVSVNDCILQSQKLVEAKF